MGADRRFTAAALIFAAGLAAIPLTAQQSAPPAGANVRRQAAPIGPRDFRPEPPATGTSIIRGRVTAAGASSPLRGAGVLAISRAAGETRTTTTNADGWFEFDGLTTGGWTIAVDKSGYLPGRFGQRTVNGPGTTVMLTGGDTHSISVALVKGAVLAGQVVDETGEAVRGIRVEAMRWSTSEGRRTLVPGESDQTDDTGSYRIHSLPPGEYVVMVRHDRTPSAMMSGSGRAAAPTYFPGITSLGEAQRITLRPGEERSGLVVALSSAQTVQVTGTVVSSSGQPVIGLASVVSLVDVSGRVPGPAIPMGRPGGAFELRDVSPGAYLLVAQHRASTAPAEFAITPIVVGTDDLTGLTLVTRPGASLVGTVAGEGGTPDNPPAPHDMSVSARPLHRGMAMPRGTVWPADTAAPVRNGRFEIASIAPTSRLWIDRLPPGWALKSITIDGVDVTDTPIEFDGRQQLTAKIVLTNRITQLAGAVTAGGRPAEGATVVVFAADPSKWASPSRFVRTTRADQSGSFTIAGLPPLEGYLAVAVDGFEDGMEQDPDFLERLRTAATPLALAQGESRRLTLTVGDR